MAVDLAGTVTYLKDHAVEHGFHVHDERHFVETYTLRQAWEVDVHPAGVLAVAHRHRAPRNLQQDVQLLTR